MFLTNRPIELSELVREVSRPELGGIAVFLGAVRNHHEGKPVLGIEYSAYSAMAESVCREIVAEATRRWPVQVDLRHRLGELVPGDPAVGVVAAGAHREEAFAACRYVIEELKRRVPIWKRERYADGTTEWVDPTRGLAGAVGGAPA